MQSGSLFRLLMVGCVGEGGSGSVARGASGTAESSKRREQAETAWL